MPQRIGLVDGSGYVGSSIAKNACMKSVIIDCSHGEVTPRIEIVDSELPVLFTKKYVDRMKIDLSKAGSFLGLRGLRSPQETIMRIVRIRFARAWM